MSLKSDQARLEYVLKMIADIDFIISRHGSIQKTLKDTEGYHAVMMCLMQTGETLNRIGNNELRASLPVSLAYGFRNIIAHDYLGINSNVVISTVENDLPALKKTIKRLIQNS